MGSKLVVQSCFSLWKCNILLIKFSVYIMYVLNLSEHV